MKKATEAQKAAAQEKRAKLIQLSKQAKLLVQLGEAETVNEGLIQIYNSGENHTWNTFQGWKQEGKRVRKGEHGSLVWGKKRKATGTDEEGEEKEFKFFPTSTLFNESQVQGKEA